MIRGLIGRWLESGALDLPLPGAGATAQRWRRLAELTAADVVAGRLAEAHTDAVAILAELTGPEPKPDQLWGVWAAESRDAVLSARGDGTSVTLDGTKPWCSGAGLCTHALVTARLDSGDRGLFAVELDHDSVRALPSTWRNAGMAESDTRSVQFGGTPAVGVGEPGDYLSRPGFWHGAVGVSACWLGGAQAVAAPLYERAGDESTDPHLLAHLGAVDAALAAAEAVLVSAAGEIDADPLNRKGTAELIARRARAVVETAVEEAIRRTARALGPAPLCQDAQHARRVADLTIYVRQSHAERDLEQLGRLAGGQALMAMPADPPIGNSARFAARPLPGGGTPTAVWLNAERDVPELDLSGCPEIVVVAAHPDDETLGFGATAAMLSELGVRVLVVSATDGGASHPTRSLSQRHQLEQTRRSELHRAVGILGLPTPVSLGLPDGELVTHEDRLADLLTDILVTRPPGTWCAATWRGDGHPDHEAVGRAAAAATRRTGAVLIEYPVWMWHWAQPGDPAVPWDRAHAVPLTSAAIDRKSRAAQCFRTQFEPSAAGPPVLPPAVLRRLLAVGEVVFR